MTIRGEGAGGPNQEYALALAIALDGASGIAALAADTDGADGGRARSGRSSGRLRRSGHARRARVAGLDPAAHLSGNDSTPFFRRLGDLLETGPTLTNANDLRAIVVGPGP